MEKLKKFLIENIYSINRCKIHIGKYLVNDKDLIFDKKISKEKFDSLLSKFVTSKYSVKKEKIYNYKNYFYNVNDNEAYRITNNCVFDIKDNSMFVETYTKEDINYTKFSCKKDYDNIYEYELTQVSLAPELHLNFVHEKNFYTFTIEITIDANIDNTLKKLDSLLALI